MTEQLKPCPFCGNEEIHKKYDPIWGLYVVSCRRCEINMKDADSGEKATEAWNNRALDKESIHWHKYHHPKCQDCKHWQDESAFDYRCNFWDKVFEREIFDDKFFYCAKWTAKE